MNPYYLVGISSVALAAFSQTLLKKAAGISWENRLREYLNVFVIAGYGMLGVSMILTIICYSRLGYMQTVILEPLAYIAVLILGRLIFGEKITLRKICGMAFIIAGILVFNLMS